MRKTVRCNALVATMTMAVALGAAGGDSYESARTSPGGPGLQGAGLDDELFQAMRWRNIGPFRGGRSVAVAGVVGDADTYYFGGTGGGVWKSTDGGETWTNVSDGFFNTGSVGAIAVAESDPNVVYVGMGEHAVRGVATSHGDGVYKSTDAGKTWRHLGLDRSRHIARIRVHPNDPELVYVAVQGALHGDSEERGVYRSSDGGETWQKILYVDERSGAAELSMDMTNPRILYAAMWDHRRWPWKVESGGPGSGVWKTTDGRATWNPINQGLPELMGKIGVDVSRADPERVYAIVEAMPGEGGLYRSDDAGATWSHVNAERIIQTRSWYYMEVFADPGDANVVHVLNAPYMKSIDAGRTFANVTVPHGDNHDLWINPDDNRIMINANDGGANVSYNGGRSWSTQRNQPTAQFYRVITDNQFPYHVYGGQQDNSSVAIASAAPGGIDWKAWYAVSGCESAYLAFNPDDPEYVLGTCIQGDIDVWDRKTGQVKPIRAYPELNLGVDPADQTYRFDWNNPVVGSPHDPNVFYQAGNVLFRTDDLGQSWSPISPDLTFNDPEKLVPSGPITNEAAGGEVYHVIFYVIESPHEAGTIWAGTNDGRVQLTRDGGERWEDVTPAFPAEGMVNSIEVSPHDPAKAYVAFTRYKFDDFSPLIYRTRDYGNNWTLIADGIDEEAWARVVREDPVRDGLLYAGTETGLYMSLDDGDTWQKWQLNLPVVPITDLTVHDTDLVAATQGRSFWILDDLSPVRQITQQVAARAFHLYEPRDAVLVNWGGGFGFGPDRSGENPPSGAVLYYNVAAVGEGDTITLEVLDSGDQSVRVLSTDPEARPGSTPLEAPRPGLNRVVWDFRHDPIAAVPDLFVFGGGPPGQAGNPGRIVPPGSYRVRLTVGEETAAVRLQVRADPRRRATLEEYAQQDRFLAAAAELLTAVNHALTDMMSIREQTEAVLERSRSREGADAVVEEGEALVDDIGAWIDRVAQTRQETFQDVINFTNKFNAQVAALMASVDGAEPPVTSGATTRLTDLLAEWEEHRAVYENTVGSRLEGFNAAVDRAGIPAVIVGR